jgi:hypothetical protein
MPNESIGEKLLGKPLAQIKRAEIAEIMADVEALLADEGLLLDIGIEKGRVPCFWCSTEVFSDVGLVSHMQKHPDVVAAITNDIDKGRPAMEHAVRLHASNRQIIAQLELWGWTKGKTRRDELQMFFHRPGEKPAEAWVRREHVEAANPHSIWAYLYDITGVTPEEFWKGPASVIDLRKAEPTTEILAKQAAGRAKNISTRVLEFLLAQDTVLTTSFISESLGFTETETARACSYLVGRGLARNVKRSMWAAVNQHHHQTTEDIDVVVTTDRQGTEPSVLPEPVVTPQDPRQQTVPPMPEEIREPFPPEVPVLATPVDLKPLSPDPSTEEVLALLDMISPKGFKAADLPAVMAWVESTQALMRRLG